MQSRAAARQSVESPSSQALADVCDKHTIPLMVPFGSHARGFARDESDYDIAVEFVNGRNMHWESLFEDLLPYFPTDRIDLVELGKAPPLLAWCVATTGSALLDRSSRDWIEFRKRAVKQFEDVRHFDRWRLRRIDRILRSLP